MTSTLLNSTDHLASPAHDDADAGDDRRRAHRQRVLLGGKIVHSHGNFSTDCVIRNLSTFGARILLSAGSVVPDTFDLIEMKNGASFSCRVVWRAYPQVGVTFERQDMLMDAETPHLKTLRRLWLDSQVRG